MDIKIANCKKFTFIHNITFAFNFELPKTCYEKLYIHIDKIFMVKPELEKHSCVNKVHTPVYQYECIWQTALMYSVSSLSIVEQSYVTNPVCSFSH